MTTQALAKATTARESLRRIGASGCDSDRTPRNVTRPNFLRAEDDHDLVTRPLASPTGPGGAEGFENRAGSQIAVPEVTNVYLGSFWADRGFVDDSARLSSKTATSIRASNGATVVVRVLSEAALMGRSFRPA